MKNNSMLLQLCLCLLAVFSVLGMENSSSKKTQDIEIESDEYTIQGEKLRYVQGSLQNHQRNNITGSKYFFPRAVENNIHNYPHTWCLIGRYVNEKVWLAFNNFYAEVSKEKYKRFIVDTRQMEIAIIDGYKQSSAYRKELAAMCKKDYWKAFFQGALVGAGIGGGALGLWFYLKDKK